MRHNYSTYLRTHRKKSGLSQREAAELVGLESGQIISRHESKTRIPSLLAALAYQIVFDVPLRALFPELYKRVEQEVLVRACALRDRIAKQDGAEPNGSDQRRAYKLGCLNAVIERIEAPDEV